MRMRLLVNSAVAILVAGLISGAWLLQKSEAVEETALMQVQSAVSQIKRELRLRAAMGQAEINGRGWPMTVDPGWFDNPPRNVLISQRRPWVEVAPPEHAELLHPPIRIATDEDVAAFWYNPANGVVRARAPITLSDRRTTEIYNRINGAAISSIFERVMPPSDVRIAPTLAPQDAVANAEEPAEPPFEEGDREPARP